MPCRCGVVLDVLQEAAIAPEQLWVFRVLLECCPIGRICPLLGYINLVESSLNTQPSSKERKGTLSTGRSKIMKTHPGHNTVQGYRTTCTTRSKDKKSILSTYIKVQDKESHLRYFTLGQHSICGKAFCASHHTISPRGLQLASLQSTPNLASSFRLSCLRSVSHLQG